MMQLGYLYVDKNGFLAVGDYKEEGKEFTRTFYGYPYIDFDHTVLLFHKGHIIEKQWKDIGSTQQILAYRNQYTPFTDSPNMDVLIAGFCILSKEKDGQQETLHKIHKLVKPYVDTLGVLEYENMQATGRKFLATGIDEMLLDNNLVAFLFGVLLAHGTWTIKDTTLYPVKLTLPLSSSLFGKKEMIEKIFEKLHKLHLAHSYTFEQSSTFEYCQVTFHDGILLKQWQKWLSRVLSIANNSVSDYTQSVYEVLREYTCAKNVCIDWKYDTIQLLPVD